MVILIVGSDLLSRVSLESQELGARQDQPVTLSVETAHVAGVVVILFPVCCML